MADERALTEAVKTRRQQLGLTPLDIQRVGGPSIETQRKIDMGTGAPYRERTLISLDRCLQWKPGTCQSILDGKADADPETWVDPNPEPPVTTTRSAHDEARASDHVTASGPVPAWIKPPARSQSGTAALGISGHARKPSDPVAVLSEAGWAYLNLVQELDGEAPAAVQMRQAILNYLHDLLVRDLSKETS